jgi:hypothetical protein
MAPVLAIAVAVFAVLFAVILFVGTPSRARRHYRQYKDMQAPMTGS